jgi:hypothetical protein
LDRTSRGLLEKCIAASRDGADFPTIWHGIIKSHPLVIGPPVQRVSGGLEIVLISGQRLLYDSDKNEFSIA